MKLFRWAIALALLSVASLANATDIPITPTGPVWKFTAPGGPGALTWGVTGPGGFNNNFFFTPINNNENVCVYVYNNNPTNAHTFLSSVVVNGNPSNGTPSDATWQPALSFNAYLVQPSPSIPVTLSVSASGVSQISLNFSSSTTQAGNPDTATVVIAQTTSPCFTGSGSAFGGQLPVSAISGLQANSESLSQSYFALQNITNTGIGQLLVAVVANGSGSRQAYYSRAVISTSASGEVDVNTTTTAGTTCTAAGLSVQNMHGGAANPQFSTFGTCVANPAVNATFKLFLAANSQYTFDLTGLVEPSSTAGTVLGVSITTPAAITGTVHASLFWYEK